MNGVNLEGMRHSEVVALIKEGGEVVRLLVMDQETDELFLTLGLPPTISHEKGQLTKPTKTLTNFLTHSVGMFSVAPSQRCTLMHQLLTANQPPHLQLLNYPQQIHRP